MRKPRRNTRLWLYLYQNGILQTGDEELIAKSIKDYKRKYDRELKQQKRKEEKRSFSISFPITEIIPIRKRSKDYHLNVVDYIKALVKADLTKTSTIQQLSIFKEILLLLQDCRNAIQNLEERDNMKWFGKSNYASVVDIILKLEQEIISVASKHL
jgi:hypothetical protein